MKTSRAAKLQIPASTWGRKMEKRKREGYELNMGVQQVVRELKGPRYQRKDSLSLKSITKMMLGLRQEDKPYRTS